MADGHADHPGQFAALAALHLHLGMPDDSTAAPDTTQRKAYDLLAAGFGAGFNGPLVVVVDAAAGTAQTTAGQVAQRIGGLADVAAVSRPTLNRAGDTVILTVIPASGPSDTATEDLVRNIRAAGGPAVAVTGLTAINIDISAKLGAALVPYLIVVVGLAFILLMLVFRSVLVPVKATLGFLLSVAATFGAVVAVFPAAIIMISVFCGFLLAPDAIIKSIGFALGVAVLFDALVVRMTIVPAVMTLLREAAWWLPRWLDRLLPDVDVEGEKLRRRLDGPPAVPAEPSPDHAVV